MMASIPYVDGLETRFNRKNSSSPFGRITALAAPITLLAIASFALQAQAATAGAVINEKSGRCLDVPGFSAASNTKTTLYDCASEIQSNQQWEHTAAGELRTLSGTRCLEVAGQSTEPAARIQTSPCNGGAHQKWDLNADGTIVGVQSKLCLTAYGAGTANGTPIDLWPCRDRSYQKWKLSGSPAPGPSNNLESPLVINGFSHPAALHTMDDLVDFRKKIVGSDPAALAKLNKMKALVDRPGRRVRNPATENPQGSGGALIYCGSYNRGEDGKYVPACDWAVDDGTDAYTAALIGHVTRDARYSRIALQYIESWTNFAKFKGIDPRSVNARLQHGWIIPWYVNAAEILRVDRSLWQERHTTAMENFLTRMLPLTIDDNEGPPNNWLHSRIEAHMSAAIFLSDRAAMNKAVERWKEHTRSYIYIDADRGTPVMPDSSKIANTGPAYWRTSKFSAGMTMETCRDLAHQGLGMRSIFNSLEMGSNNKYDMLGGQVNFNGRRVPNDNRERLTRFFEVMPVWTQSRQDHPDGICRRPVVANPPTLLSAKAIRHSYPLGYSLLKSPSRPLVRAKEDIDKSAQVGVHHWVTKWEMLWQ